MPKYTEKEVLDLALGDHRIASWIRTEYRNKVGAEKPEPKPEAEPKQQTEPAKADR
jgi:hypothetical protein